MSGNYVRELKRMSKEQREEEIDSKIHEVENDLMNTEAVAREITNSNATGWKLDVCEVLAVTFSEPNKAHAKIAFEFSGDQKDDRPFSGTKINGEAVAIFNAAGEVNFENATAERDLGAD